MVLADLDIYWNYNENLSSCNVENIKDFFNRIYEVMGRIIEKYKKKEILIVTHSCVMIGIDCFFYGIKPDFNFKNYCFHNGKYIKYII